MAAFVAGSRFPVLLPPGARFFWPVPARRPAPVPARIPALMVFPSWWGGPQYHAATFLGGPMGQRLVPTTVPPPLPEDLSDIRGLQQLQDAIESAEKDAEDTCAEAERWREEHAKDKAAADDLAGQPGEAEANLMAHDSLNRWDDWSRKCREASRRVADLNFYLSQLIVRMERGAEPEPTPAPTETPLEEGLPIRARPKIVLPPPSLPTPTLPVVPQAYQVQPAVSPVQLLPAGIPTAATTFAVRPLEAETTAAPGARVPVATAASVSEAPCPPGTVQTAQGCMPEGAGVATPSKFPLLQKLLPLVGGLPGPTPTVFGGA